MDRATRTINFKRGVYKLGYAGKTYYRIGFSPQDSRRRLALEMGVDAEVISILDERSK